MAVEYNSTTVSEDKMDGWMVGGWWTDGGWWTGGGRTAAGGWWLADE